MFTSRRLLLFYRSVKTLKHTSLTTTLQVQKTIHFFQLFFRDVIFKRVSRNNNKFMSILRPLNELEIFG